MKLHLHILRAHFGPFLFSLSTLMFIFLLQFIMKFVDQLVGKGLSMFVIGELIMLNLAWMVVLAVPMSVLVATLMAFGGMSSANEITAMKASGMSLYRMMITVVLSSLAVTYLLLQFNNRVLPEANHRLKTLVMDIRRLKPTLTIMPGLFSQEISGYSILARRTFEKSNDLEGITIYDYTDPGMNVVVTAGRGKIAFTPESKRFIMDLWDGEIHQVSVNDPRNYRRMRFERHRIVVPTEGFDFERSSASAFSRGDREMSATEMRIIVDSLQHVNEESLRQTFAIAGNQTPGRAIPRTQPGVLSDSLMLLQATTMAINQTRMTVNAIDNQIMLISYNAKQINEYLVEIHKKYAIPVACIVFVFIGAPLGVMVRRGTFGVAASLSLGFFLLYWASLIGGEKLADRGFIQPWLGMWMANIVLGALGIVLTVRIAREIPSVDLSWMKRFVPKFFRVDDGSSLPTPTA